MSKEKTKLGRNPFEEKTGQVKEKDFKRPRPARKSKLLALLETLLDKGPRR